MPVALFAADSPRGLIALLHLWPIWLPVAVGGLAIFWLLPRPRQRSPLLGAAAGGLAMLLGGGLLVRTETLSVESGLFYAFAGLAIVAGTLLVTQQHPARAALSFALVVLSTCGLFLLLAAPFLMAATIIVYAGAIVVTFLFVIMLAQQEGLGNADARSREPLLATITGFLLLAAILYVLRAYNQTGAYDEMLAEVVEILALESDDDIQKRVGEFSNDEDDHLFNRATRIIGDKERGDLDRLLFSAKLEWGGMGDPPPSHRHTILKVRTALLAGRQRLTMAKMPDVDEMLAEMRSKVGGNGDGAAGRSRPPLPLSAMSGTPANTLVGEVRRNPRTLVPDLPAENAAYLGRSLFTDFLLPVELGGTLLLVATVGAIAIAQRRTSVGGGAKASTSGTAPGRLP